MVVEARVVFESNRIGAQKKIRAQATVLRVIILLSLAGQLPSLRTKSATP